MSANSQKEKLILLIDYNGWSLMNAPPMKTSMETLSILQNHYPERLHKAYCIRPPWIFNAFWNMITPFIDPDTKAKIIMTNTTNKQTLPYLEHINIDIVETELGGNDSRPFNSELYLNTSFEKDFLTILEESNTK